MVYWSKKSYFHLFYEKIRIEIASNIPLHVAIHLRDSINLIQYKIGVTGGCYSIVIVISKIQGQEGNELCGEYYVQRKKFSCNDLNACKIVIDSISFLYISIAQRYSLALDFQYDNRVNIKFISSNNK